jgi:virulence-associated protein VapD
MGDVREEAAEFRLADVVRDIRAFRLQHDSDFTPFVKSPRP